MLDYVDDIRAETGRATAAIDGIGRSIAAVNGLTLTVFIDQDAGRLAVMLPDAERRMTPPLLTSPVASSAPLLFTTPP